MLEDFGFAGGDHQVAEVNMAPLIDMVFILLIFFVVTTNFNRQTGVEVTKPKAQSAVATGQKVLLVGVTREGTLHVHGRQVTLERLRALVAQEVERRPDMAVVIISDREAPIGRAVQVMDQCTMAGAQKVSIAADKE